MIIKKICMVFVYYFLTSLLDQLVMVIFGNYFISLLLSLAIVAFLSYLLRAGSLTRDLEKLNNKDLAVEKYDGKTTKEKLKYIMTTPSFITDVALAVIVSAAFMIYPPLATGVSTGFAILYLSPAFMLIFTVLFVPANLAIWYFAYNKVYRVKDYYNSKKKW